jgi:predicted metal-dependent phosphoesterase TrpH
MCTVPLLRAVCRESYNEPVAVYEKLKRLGMGLVTVTGHDSIDGAEALRARPDFFLSEEVTWRLPSGTELHMGVYDITERDHLELARRRDDFERLLAWLAERNLFFTANHVLSSLTGRRTLDDFGLFAAHFPALETYNGHMLRAANRGAAALAAAMRKVPAGGSDAHAMAPVGSAYTAVPGARNKAEYLAGLRRGCGVVAGETGSIWKLTRDVLAIGAAMMRERPATAALAPLALALPFVTLANYVQEAAFARRWLGRYERERQRYASALRAASCPAIRPLEEVA